MGRFATATDFEGFFKPAEHKDELVLVNGLKYYDNLQEQLGLKPHPRADQTKPNPGIVAEVVVFGRGRPEVLGTIMITQGTLVKKVREFVGVTPYLGVLSMIEKPDVSYWTFRKHTAEQGTKAERFIDEHPDVITEFGDPQPVAKAASVPAQRSAPVQETIAEDDEDEIFESE